MTKQHFTSRGPSRAFAAAALLLLGACQSAAPPASAAPNAVTLPFAFVHNEIIIDAALGDSGPHRFMLDCGVDPSAIDIALARSLGISVDEANAGEATGAGDEEGLAVMESSIPGLGLGGMRFETIAALAADLTPFGEALELPLAGILGHSFLENHVVRIDYPARQVTIASRREDLGTPATPVTRRHVLPLAFESAEILIPVFTLEIDGQPVPVTLDTGSSGGIELYPATVARLGLEEEKATGESAEALGARGLRTLTKGQLENVGLGAFTVPLVDTRFSDSAGGTETVGGNAGNKLFQDFVLTLDYVNREIMFEQ